MSTDDITVEEADLGPETTVWTTTVKSTSQTSKKLHLNPKCRNLKQAGCQQPKQLAVFPAEHQDWCSVCADGVSEVAVRD